MALDREEILKTVYGEAALYIDGGIPESDSWYMSKEKDGLHYQPEVAKQILIEKGFDFDESIVLTRYHQDDMSVKLLQEIANYWNAIGVKTIIEPIGPNETDKLWKDTDWYDV